MITLVHEKALWTPEPQSHHNITFSQLLSFSALDCCGAEWHQTFLEYWESQDFSGSRAVIFISLGIREQFYLWLLAQTQKEYLPQGAGLSHTHQCWGNIQWKIKHFTVLPWKRAAVSVRSMKMIDIISPPALMPPALLIFMKHPKSSHITHQLSWETNHSWPWGRICEPLDNDSNRISSSTDKGL